MVPPLPPYRVHGTRHNKHRTGCKPHAPGYTAHAYTPVDIYNEPMWRMLAILTIGAHQVWLSYPGVKGKRHFVSHRFSQ